jgi:metal-responsive CopG/Arc/MetJ family transcriptional regulator
VSRLKIAITLDEESLSALDRLVSERRFPNRSQAIQEAVDEKLARLSQGRLARECAKLDAATERALADEGMGGDLASWPEY